MTEKTSNESKVCNRETSRRSFLKTSAAIAGAAVLGESFYASLAAASTEERQDVTDIQLLFVQNAADVVMKDSKLILVGISPTTIFFSDRPNRLAGHMHTDEFVEDWQEGKGKESRSNVITVLICFALFINEKNRTCKFSALPLKGALKRTPLKGVLKRVPAYFRVYRG